MLETFVLGAIGSVAGSAAYEGLKAGYRQLANHRPDLEAKAVAAEQTGSSAAIAAVVREAQEALILEARSGSIQLDGAALHAIGLTRLDHGQGDIIVQNTSIAGATVELGGGAGATGRTVLGGNSSSRSQGTAIEIGTGASITISGNASIKQS